MDLKKVFSDNVKYYRNMLGISQEKLAERSNFSTNYVGSIESQVRRVNIDTIQKLAIGLQIEPSKLLIDRNKTKKQ